MSPPKFLLVVFMCRG